MIYYIRTNERYNINRPTQGVDITNYVQSKRNIIFYDIGGNFESRKLYKYYKNNCDGIIYVIDSTDKKRLPYKKKILNTIPNNGKITKGGDTRDSIDLSNNGTITDDGGAIVDDISPGLKITSISITSVTSVTSATSNESNTSLSTPVSSKPDISPRNSSTSIINNGFITAEELKFDKPSPPKKKKSKSKSRNKSKISKYKPSPPKIKPPKLDEYKRKKGLSIANDDEKEGYNKNTDNYRYTTIAAPLDPIKFDLNKVSNNKELISLLNYDISDNKIPFLMYEIISNLSIIT